MFLFLNTAVVSRPTTVYVFVVKRIKETSKKLEFMIMKHFIRNGLMKGPPVLPVLVLTVAMFVASQNQDYQWTSFGEFGACSVTCGNKGFRKRYRYCQPGGDAGDKNRRDYTLCKGDNISVKYCNEQPLCPTENVIDKLFTKKPTKPTPGPAWAPWQPVGHCSVTCGEGQRQFTRDCSNPPTPEDGLMCNNKKHAVRICLTGIDCKVIENSYTNVFLNKHVVNRDEVFLVIMWAVLAVLTSVFIVYGYLKRRDYLQETKEYSDYSKWEFDIYLKRLMRFMRGGPLVASPSAMKKLEEAPCATESEVNAVIPGIQALKQVATVYSAVSDFAMDAPRTKDGLDPLKIPSPCENHAEKESQMNGGAAFLLTSKAEQFDEETNNMHFLYPKIYKTLTGKPRCISAPRTSDEQCEEPTIFKHDKQERLIRKCKVTGKRSLLPKKQYQAHAPMRVKTAFASQKFLKQRACRSSKHRQSTNSSSPSPPVEEDESVWRKWPTPSILNILKITNDNTTVDASKVERKESIDKTIMATTNKPVLSGRTSDDKQQPSFTRTSLPIEVAQSEMKKMTPEHTSLGTHDDDGDPGQTEWSRKPLLYKKTSERSRHSKQHQPLSRRSSQRSDVTELPLQERNRLFGAMPEGQPRARNKKNDFQYGNSDAKQRDLGSSQLAGLIKRFSMDEAMSRSGIRLLPETRSSQRDGKDVAQSLYLYPPRSYNDDSYRFTYGEITNDIQMPKGQKLNHTRESLTSPTRASFETRRGADMHQSPVHSDGILRKALTHSSFPMSHTDSSYLQPLPRDNQALNGNNRNAQAKLPAQAVNPDEMARMESTRRNSPSLRPLTDDSSGEVLHHRHDASMSQRASTHQIVTNVQLNSDIQNVVDNVHPRFPRAIHADGSLYVYPKLSYEDNVLRD